MIGVKRYKDDLREAQERMYAALDAAKVAEARAEKLARDLAAEKAKPPQVRYETKVVEKPAEVIRTVTKEVPVEVHVDRIVEVIKEVEVEKPVEIEKIVEVPVETIKEVEVLRDVVKIAAPANVADRLSGTNAQKIAAMDAIIGTLQERLRAAGLEWEV